MSDLISWYQRLPYRIKSAVASAKGRRLQRVRYGPETDRLVDEALARESWKPSQWHAWHEEHVPKLLHRAATRVPYYREAWAARRAAGDRSTWEDLANWPVLEKETVRANPLQFVVDDVRPSKLHRRQTSGSTGQPLPLWQSTASLRRWYALFEARWRGWNGVSRRDPWANLAGQRVAAFDREQPPFWVWNGGMRQLYLSCYHLKPANLPHYLDAMARHDVVYIYGLASSMHTLALGALERGGGPRLQCVISNAEVLHPHHREALSKAFECPVVDTYGMTEMVAGASECSAGRLHLWPEAGITEVWDEEADAPAPAGQAGAIVATGLINGDMPLVRYAPRDWGSLAPATESCSCGRTLPILQSIEGRVDDLILTPDGRKVMVIWSFLNDLPVRETQVVQESRDEIQVNYVPGPEFDEHHGETMVARLHERLGAFTIRLNPMDEIPRRPNGKFRAVISRVCPAPPEA